MYQQHSIEQTRVRVAERLASEPFSALSSLCEQLEQSEAEVTLALPSEMVTEVAGEHAEAILQQLPSWGKVTTIVHSGASIFEFKAPFPKGKLARGYYNLMGKEGELHGHLRLDLVTHIALVSKPFMKMESHYMGFFDGSGHCVFKVYLGRDKQRKLFPEQIALFQQLKQELS